MPKQALGKGLGALIGRSGSGVGGKKDPEKKPAANIKPGDAVQKVPLDLVVASPLQPRKEFAPDHLSELVDSIREHGIIQPLIVRKVVDNFELIAGERRLRASQELGLKKVPVIVREASDRDVLEMALIENLQREDLNPVEEAQAYVRLAKEFGLRQEDIARRVGKNRATVANAMRVLDLPSPVQDMLARGDLSVGHAKVILGAKSSTDQEVLALEVAKKGLTVRDTEKLLAAQQKPQTSAPKKKDTVSDAVAIAVQEVQNRLREHFATNVRLAHGDHRGKVEIEYYGTEDLNRILGLLGVEEADLF